MERVNINIHDPIMPLEKMQEIQNPELVKSISTQFKIYHIYLDQMLGKVLQKAELEIPDEKLIELKAFEKYLRVFNPVLANEILKDIQDLELYVRPRPLQNIRHRLERTDDLIDSQPFS
jgi:hypothetical protein